MKYNKYDISQMNLTEGMIVEGKIKQIKQYGAFIELTNRNQWTSIYRRHISI